MILIFPTSPPSSRPAKPTVYSITWLEFPKCIAIQNVHCACSADSPSVFQQCPSTYKAESLSTIESRNPTFPDSFASGAEAYDIGSVNQTYFSQTLNQQLMTSRSRIQMGSILVTGVAAAAVTAGQHSKVSSGYCAGSIKQLVLPPDRTGGGSCNVCLEADDIFIKPISYHDLGFCFWLCSLRTLLPHPPYNSKNYLIFV